MFLLVALVLFLANGHFIRCIFFLHCCCCLLLGVLFALEQWKLLLCFMLFYLVSVGIFYVAFITSSCGFIDEILTFFHFSCSISHWGKLNSTFFPCLNVLKVYMDDWPRSWFLLAGIKIKHSYQISENRQNCSMMNMSIEFNTTKPY